MQLLEGKATVKQLLRNWIVSFTGNFVGSVALVALVSASGMMAMPGPSNMAAAKTSLTFVQVMHNEPCHIDSYMLTHFKRHLQSLRFKASRCQKRLTIVLSASGVC